MSIPSYSHDLVFSQLAEICESAGIPVIFDDIEEGIYARTQKFTGIVMSNDENRFQSSAHAAMILGHELGHQLIEPVYVGKTSANPDVPKDDIADNTNH